MGRPMTYDPLADLRHGLEDARRAGADFDSAWTVSLSAARFPRDTATRIWYRAALAETREHWADAYEGRPARYRGATAIAYLAAALDGEPLFGRPEPAAPVAHGANISIQAGFSTGRTRPKVGNRAA